ncbi:uncharacterized protein B0H18DRAFT_496762 [Fomitopsis serialis]|uniref:uncharacterized protein n=1 Tax=Fomitopsis serialis TaxID=139415 RepID=UPI00200891E3|nr:uncharacterized protein B0H18DRAFT_496762 [Neoantrodia serialis]KAH9922894.1 hypothetical protein B0H18DRAFT_496762 [Neoantrodia serialis]
MLADVPRRMPLLTALSLTKEAFRFEPSDEDVCEEDWIMDYSAASQLALVIRLSPSLRKLSILDAEGVFSKVPELGDAVAGLTRLDDIRFGWTHDSDVTTHDVTVGVLSRLKSQPRKVECYILQTGVGLNRGEDRFLGSFTTSVTTLKLRRHPEVILTLAPNTFWPAVESLELEGDQNSEFFINNRAHFARAFPNVRRLKILDHSCRVPSTSIPATANHWRNLDFVSISSPLPVGRPVRHLHYSANTASVHWRIDQYANDTQEFLRQSSPVTLSCRAQQDLVEWVAATASSLRVLQLHYVCRPRGHAPGLADDSDMRGVIDMFCPYIGLLQLRAFSFSLAFTLPLDDASVLRHAVAIALHIPALHYIGIQLHGGEELDVFQYKWARVVSRPQQGEPVLEMVPEYDVDALERTLLATPRD